MTTFNLPDLGEGLQEAEIVSWHVSEGDHVVADQPIVSVETEKAVIEIPSPQSGRISKLFGRPGEMVPVGSPLVTYDDGEADRSETVVGDLQHDEDRDAPAPSKRVPVRAAPAVRQLARTLGVELVGVSGSGPHGTITENDVRRSAGAVDDGALGQKLSGTRRAMARKMTEAGAAIVPATVTADADVSEWYGRDDPTVRLLQSVVSGCRAEPVLNAWYDPSAERKTNHRHVDIGLAVDTKDGLFVPVLRNAETLDADRLTETLNGLKQQVIDRSVGRTGFKDPTITLSNFGTLAGRYANLVIVPPQVAILGAGRIADRVLSVDSQSAIRPVLPLSLTFDHRVVTGAEAARFLRAVIDSLEAEFGFPQ